MRPGDRPPPERTPPLFKVGDRVWVTYYRTRYLGTVWKIRPYTQEELVRTAYAAGFWAYYVEDCAHIHKSTTFSFNLLELAAIDTLGSLVDG